MIDVQSAILLAGQEGVGEGAGQVLDPLKRPQLVPQKWLGCLAVVLVLLWGAVPQILQILGIF